MGTLLGCLGAGEVAQENHSSSYRLCFSCVNEAVSQGFERGPSSDELTGGGTWSVGLLFWAITALAGLRYPGAVCAE